MSDLTDNTEILIAIGANLPGPAGPPDVTVMRAIETISDHGIDVLRRSRWYRTTAFPDQSDPEFINGVISVQTDLDAAGLLERLHAIEAVYGRRRRQRWSPRSLDLDLLSYGDDVQPDHETWNRVACGEYQNSHGFILPHPRMHLRRFVMRPLAEIMPEWRHPVLGRTAREILESLPRDAA